MLLPDQVKQELHQDPSTGAIRSTGTIRIWKEIKVRLSDGLGDYHHVRAFHDFDVHGSFFDWVNVKADWVTNDGELVENYYPAKVLLLYQTEEGEDFAVIWKACAATDTESALETNLSARWRMSLQRNGFPQLDSISTDKIESCISVYAHWSSVNPFDPGLDKSLLVIDTSYDRYSWALNFVDESRWKSCVGVEKDKLGGSLVLV
jgi:hypothetical protein